MNQTTVKQSESSDVRSENIVSAAVMSQYLSDNVTVFQTAVVKVGGRDEKLHLVRLVIGTGSNCSIITTRLADILGLK